MKYKLNNGRAELITQDIVDDYGEEYFNKQSWYDL